MKRKMMDHPILSAAVLFGVYVLLFLVEDKLWTREAVWIVHSSLDDVIPFTKWALIPYLLWFPLIPAGFIYTYLQGRKEFWRFVTPMTASIYTAILFNALVPNALAIAKEPIEGTDLLTQAVNLLYGFDPPTNVFPSLHVIIAVVIGMAFWRSPAMRKPGRSWIRVLLMFLVVAICLSTVMLKQHSILDVFGGLAVAAFWELLAVRFDHGRGNRGTVKLH